MEQRIITATVNTINVTFRLNTTKQKNGCFCCIKVLCLIYRNERKVECLQFVFEFPGSFYFYAVCTSKYYLEMDRQSKWA